MKRSDGLGLLGLARRAGKLIVGAEESRRAIRRGVVRVVVVADDGAAGQRIKVVALAEAMGIPVVAATTRATLGQAVGAGLVTAVAVTDKGLGVQLLETVGHPGRVEKVKSATGRARVPQEKRGR